MSEERKEAPEKTAATPAKTLGTKYPFDYELSPGDVSEHDDRLLWYEVRLRNISGETMTDLEVKLNLIDPQGNAEQQDRLLGNLGPNEPKTLSFLVHASETSQVYLTVHGHEKDLSFHWDAEKGMVRSKHRADAAKQELKKLHAESEKAKKAFLRRQKKAKTKANALAHTKIAEAKDELKKDKEAFGNWSQKKDERIAEAKRKAKTEIKSEIAEIKNEDFETLSKKNREDVQKSMTGEADASTS